MPDVTRAAARSAVVIAMLVAESCSLQNGGSAGGASQDAGPDVTEEASLDAAGPNDGTPVDGSELDVVEAGEDGGDAQPDARPDATIDAGDAGAGMVVTTAILGATADKVSLTDQGLTPDTKLDGTFEITVVGPITALVLLTTNGGGTPAGPHQWDTLVQTDPIPASINSTFTNAGLTPVLGVYDGTTRVNDGNGRISVGAGAHLFTLYASDDGFQKAGQHFRVFACTSATTCFGGPVVAWP
jgi:hypothetical protein